jgi:cytochrome aa3-600 menaquinol oxidase subunit I
VWEWEWMIILGMIGVFGTMWARSFVYDDDYYVQVDEVRSTEASLGRVY